MATVHLPFWAQGGGALSTLQGGTDLIRFNPQTEVDPPWQLDWAAQASISPKSSPAQGARPVSLTPSSSRLPPLKTFRSGLYPPCAFKRFGENNMETMGGWWLPLIIHILLPKRIGRLIWKYETAYRKQLDYLRLNPRKLLISVMSSLTPQTENPPILQSPFSQVRSHDMVKVLLPWTPGSPRHDPLPQLHFQPI